MVRVRVGQSGQRESTGPQAAGAAGMVAHTLRRGKGAAWTGAPPARFRERGDDEGGTPSAAALVLCALRSWESSVEAAVRFERESMQNSVHHALQPTAPTPHPGGSSQESKPPGAAAAGRGQSAALDADDLRYAEPSAGVVRPTRLDAEAERLRIVRRNVFEGVLEDNDGMSELERAEMDRLLLEYVERVACAPLRIWDRDELWRTGLGHRMDPLPPPKEHAELGGRWGRCFVLALPSRQHLRALAPVMGSADDVRHGCPWLRYVHQVDPRTLPRDLDIPLPKADDVIVCVGYPHRVVVRTSTTVEVLRLFRHSHRVVPSSRWEEYIAPLVPLDTTVRVTRTSALCWLTSVFLGTAPWTMKHMTQLMRSCDSDDPSDLEDICVNVLGVFGYECANCGADLPTSSGGASSSSDASLNCPSCRLTRFCSAKCRSQARDRTRRHPGDNNAPGVHDALSCRRARVLDSIVTPCCSVEQVADLLGHEEAHALLVNHRGEFNDAYFSVLAWDVSLPPESARLVPGFMCPDATCALGRRYGVPLGLPLHARHWDARCVMNASNAMDGTVDNVGNGIVNVVSARLSRFVGVAASWTMPTTLAQWIDTVHGVLHARLPKSALAHPDVLRQARKYGSARLRSVLDDDGVPGVDARHRLGPRVVADDVAMTYADLDTVHVWFESIKPGLTDDDRLVLTTVAR